MIHHLRPYPGYRDSGLPWLGEIPKHWEVRRNGRLFAKAGDTGFPDLPILEVSLKTGVRARDFDGSSRKQMMAEREKYQRARQGDLTYNMMRMWQGAVGVAPVDGLVSPAYVVARPLPGVDARYYEYLFRTGAYMDEVNLYSRGIVPDRNRLYWEQFKQMPSVFPPPEEQAAIVRFLSEADRKIRRYIRAKHRLIKLLEEQKQAIIDRAVTHGLDPNVRLKRSGVEWLGNIPTQWDIWPLKALASVQSGITLGKRYNHQPTTIYPYLRVANVQAGGLNLTEIKHIAVPEEEACRSTLQRGDVLMTEGGDPDKLGRGCVWTGEIDPCLHQNHVFAVRTDPRRLRPDFFAALLSSQYAKRYFIQTAKQTTNLASTNKTTIGRFPVLLPSLEEQDRILEVLRHDLREVHLAITCALREISLIGEYRTRLVSDVVTGRVDVRVAATTLSNEEDTGPEPDEQHDELLGYEGGEDEISAELEEVEV